MVPTGSALARSLTNARPLTDTGLRVLADLGLYLASLQARRRSTGRGLTITDPGADALHRIWGLDKGAVGSELAIG